MAHTIVYESGNLSNGNRWRYFGEISNGKRNGIGMLQWPDSGADGLSIFAAGHFVDGFINGFGMCYFQNSVELYTHLESAKNWQACGATVSVSKNCIEFYYLEEHKHVYRSFLFYNDSDVVHVRYHDNKGNVVNTEKYKLPFKFVNKTDYLFNLHKESLPHYYQHGPKGITIMSTSAIDHKEPHYSIKYFKNDDVQLGHFVSGSCKGPGVYYFKASQDVCVGEFTGTANNGYVFYTYDSGNSIRYGFLDSNDKWQGFLIELDDEHILNIIEKKDDETVKTYRISDLKLLKDGEDETIVTSTTKKDDKPSTFDPSSLIDLINGDISSTLSVEEALNGIIEPIIEEGPIKCIDDLIGLDSVKRMLKLLINMVVKHKKAGKSLKNFPMHMAFVGNPGTGKTEVAKLLAKELHKIGYLPTNKTVLVDRSILVGKYIGETEGIVQDYIKQAIGGVLVIDEAYSLHVKDSDKDYGKVVIDTLVKAMEDYKGQFVVVFAGYKEETLAMIESNPGLKSRIKRIIEFPDYTIEELRQIGEIFLKDLGYEITEDAMKLTLEIVYSEVYEKSFGNARAMRTAIETIAMCQTERTLLQNRVEDFLITIDDVKQYAALEKYEITEKGQDIMGSSFDKLIGLKRVKKTMKLIEAYVKKNKETISSTHMVFYGNPGTGKTTVARLMGKMLFRAGILPTAKTIIAKRSDLVAEYTGQTAIKTNDVIRKALGGVLFVDEAYSLTETEGGSGNRSFGTEALTTLLTAMEEQRDKLCVIFAGYKKEMDEFIKSNSGLASRIVFHLDFDDYDEDELAQIARICLEENKYQASDEVLHAIARLALSLKGTVHFANARTIRNFIFSICMHQNVRTGNNDDRVITMDDVVSLAEDQGLKLTAEAPEKALSIPSVDYLKRLSDEWDETNFKYNKQDTDERVVHLTTTKGAGMSEGSGFIITPDGYYLTCNHCIDGAQEISTRVTYYNRHGKRIYVEYKTEVVASSKEHDCALCKMIGVDDDLPYMPLSFDKIDTLADNEVVLAGYPHGLRRVNEISFFEGKIISQQNINGDDKIYTDIMGKSGCSGSAVFYKNSGKVIGVFCGAMLSHNENLTEEMNFLRPISHSIDLLKK